MIKITLNKTATSLPLKELNGSTNKRTKKAAQMNKEFFDNIKGGFTNGELSSNVLFQIIKKHTPQNIQTKFIKDYNNLRSGISVHIDDKGCISSYILSIPVKERAETVSRLKINTIMQTMSEFFERICNPKYNNRDIKFLNKKLIDTNTYETISQIYKNKDLTLEKLNEILKKFKPQEQIEILQNLRYNLKIKLNAFKQGEKYQKEIEKLYKYKNMQKANTRPYQRLQFAEKIEIIEQKLAQIIKEERAKLANS